MDRQLKEAERARIKGGITGPEYARIMLRAGQFAPVDPLREHGDIAAVRHHLIQGMRYGSVNTSDLGFGNTFNLVDAVAYLIQNKFADAALMLCTPSMLRRVDELVSEYDVPRVRMLNSLTKAAAALQNSLDTYQRGIYFTSYGMWARLCKKHSELTSEHIFDVIACHEVSKVKNPMANRSQAVYNTADRCQPTWRLGTGRIMTRALQDIWGVYRFINPTIFGTKKEFMEEWFNTYTVSGLFPFYKPKEGAPMRVADAIRHTIYRKKLGDITGLH